MANQMLQLQIHLRALLTQSPWYWPALRMYRWLSQKNIISGSSVGEELEGPQMPLHFLQSACATQAKVGLRELAHFDQNLQHRRTIAQYYQKEMQALGFAPIFEPEYAKHLFLKYVFLVRDRPHFLALAMQEGIPLGDWFLSPLHPIMEHWEPWQYEKGMCPIAERLSAHMLNLPTDQSISQAEAQRIMAFIQKHRSELIEI